MKKIILYALVVSLVLSVAIVGYIAITFQEVHIEEIVPEGAVVYGRFGDIKENIDYFMNTQLYRQLASIDYAQVLEESGLDPQSVALLREFQRQVSLEDTKALLDLYFGREIALILYPVEIKGFDLMQLQAAAGNIFFVTQLNPKIQFAEFISGYFDQFGKDTTKETIEYNGHKIHMVHIEDQGLKFGYTRIKDYLIFGIGDNAARKCIDVYKKAQKPLVKDPRYAKVKKSFLAGAESTVYVDYDYFLTTIKDKVLDFANLNPTQPAQAAILKEQIEESFKQTLGFQAVGYSSIFEKVARDKVDLHIDPDKLHPDFRSLYECEPRENRTIKFVSTDALAYQWNPCIDFGFYWQQWKSELKRTAELSGQQAGFSAEQIVASIEQAIGMDIEDDILPVFGEEVGGYLTDIDNSGVFPLPKLLFFVEVTDKTKAENLIDTLVNQQPLFRLETESQGEQMIHYLKVPMMANVSPGYSIIDNYLLISTNHDLIKDAVSTLAGDMPTLETNKSFQAMNFGLTDKNNGILFVQFYLLMSKAQGLIDWAHQWLMMEASKQQAFRTGSEQRLRDIRSKAVAQKAELDVLKADFESAKQGVDEGGILGSEQITEYEQQIEKLEKNILASRESEKELEELLKMYDNQQELSVGNRKAIMEKVAKPLLKALGSIRIFTSKVIYQKGMIESFIYWVIE